MIIVIAPNNSFELLGDISSLNPTILTNDILRI